MEFFRLKRVGFGFEISYDTSEIELEKKKDYFAEMFLYTMLNSSNNNISMPPFVFMNRDSDTENIKIGLMLSIYAVF